MELFDQDGDGYDAEVDCDDNDAAVPAIWYRDQDGDGFGLEADSVLDCSQPEGYVDNSVDCDDTSIEMNANDEDGDGNSTCDGDCDDNNFDLNANDEDGDGDSTCDGDCDDSDANQNLSDEDQDGESSCAGDCDDLDPLKNNIDLDGDTFSSCQGDCDDTDYDRNLLDNDADGFSTCDDDCRDNDPYIHPGMLEISYDGIDQDCDGLDESATTPSWEYAWVENASEAISIMNDPNLHFFSWGVGFQGYFVLYRTDNPIDETWTIAPVVNLSNGVEQLAPHVQKVRVNHSFDGDFVAYTEDDTQVSSWVLISHSASSSFYQDINEKDGVDDFLIFYGSNGQRWNTYVYDQYSYDNRFWDNNEFPDMEETVRYLNDLKYCDARISFVDNSVRAFFR